MKTLFLMLALALSSTAEETWWRVLGDIQPGNFAGGHHDEKDEDIAAMLQMTEFEEWETFEDDLVSIRYPKHPLLKLETNGGKDGISVEGGVCTTVDNSFQRAYTLKAGSATYGVFLVAKASWLDDGICMCGPMVHHVYRMEDGCLARFSLLPGGAVKKAQLLGGKLRLMSFEWTHLACPRPIYEEMVESMKLKIRHPWGEERLHEKVFKDYGMNGRSGWVHPGMSIAEVNKMMNTEATESDGLHHWRGLFRDYPVVLSARCKDGKVVALENEGLIRTGEDAVRGSLSWIEDEIERHEDARSKTVKNPDDPFAQGYGEDSPKPKILVPAPELADALVKQATGASASKWPRCLYLMDELVEKLEIADERFTGLILKHGTGMWRELDLLVELKYDKTRTWVIEKLDAMMLESPSSEEQRASMFASPEEIMGRNAKALLEWLAEHDHDAYLTAAKGLWKTKEPAWTYGVVSSLDGSDADFAQEIITGGFERAIEHRSRAILDELFEMIDLTDLPGPDAVIAQINKLYKGEADSDWEKTKTAAKESLKKMKKGEAKAGE